MNIKQIGSEKIFKLFHLLLLLLTIGGLTLSYFFINTNVYSSINFDESKYDAALSKTDDIDMGRFNDVIKKIDAKNVKKNIDTITIFD